MEKKKKPLPSKSFCIVPFIHMNIQPDGTTYHCCMSDLKKPIGNTKRNTLEEMWNSRRMKVIRRDMLNGDRNQACIKCYHVEDTGIDSPRSSSNRKFESSIDDAVANTDEQSGYNHDFRLKYWDFRWSNICNFKCRMCGVFSSSKWAEDEEAVFGTKTDAPGGIVSYNKDSKKDIMEYVDRFINDVEEIYFAGGEPLIMDEHYIILEKLIAAGRTDVRLRYNTNFSYLKFKKWDLNGLWQHFIDDPKGEIELAASLDAVGKLAEVARSGTKWSNVEKNLKAVVEKDITVDIAPTISILNAFYVHELVDLAIQFGIPAGGLSLGNILTGPGYYDLRILPNYLKRELTDKLQGYIDKCDKPEYKAILEYGYSAWKNHLAMPIDANVNELENELVRVTELLDERRSENFLEVNPQYKEWFHKIKTRSSLI